MECSFFQLSKMGAYLTLLPVESHFLCEVAPNLTSHRQAPAPLAPRL